MSTLQHLNDFTFFLIDEYTFSKPSWKQMRIRQNIRIEFKEIVAQLPNEERMRIEPKVDILMKKDMITRNMLESLKESIENLLDELKENEEECIIEEVVCPSNYVWTETYDNENYRILIHNLASVISKLDLNKYNKEPVLYIGILRIKDPLNKNRIICKIGFSDDIWGRIEKLKATYDCNFQLLGLKKIYKRPDEEQFHKKLKEDFPHLRVNMKVKGKNKREVYVFNRDIYQRFLDFAPSNIKNKIDEKTEREIHKYLADSCNSLRNISQTSVTEEEEPMAKKRKLNQI